MPKSDLSATDICCVVARQIPGGVDALMWQRNRVVQPLGVSVSTNELVLQDDDKHLLVQLSVLKQSHDAAHDRLTISTVVRIHNTPGRVYMAVVGPAHKVIAPAITRRTSRAVTHNLLRSRP